ncbi:MAG: hypothetical protein ACI9FU_001213 [Granulosicoccus sp.]|jgi:hypothetical protein
MKHTLPLILLISLLAMAGIAQPPPPGGLAATLMINELDYDQPSSDTTEFIEIYNFGAASVALDQTVLVLINGATSMSYDTIFFPAVTLAAGDYYVVCGAGGYVANCDQMHEDTADIVQNGSPDAILLYDVLEQVVIDALSYEGDVLGVVEGTGLATNMSDNNDDEAMSLSRIPNGVDSDNNSVDFAMANSTPGEENDGTVGVVEKLSKKGFVLYPNPVQNELNLFIHDVQVGSKITISNMLGKEINQTRISKSQTKVNTSLFPEGVYFVTIESIYGRQTKRFIKR